MSYAGTIEPFVTDSEQISLVKIAAISGADVSGFETPYTLWRKIVLALGGEVTGAENEQTLVFKVARLLGAEVDASMFPQVLLNRAVTELGGDVDGFESSQRILFELVGVADNLSKLPAPTNISVEVAGSGIEVTYDAVTGADHYERRYDNTGSWISVGNVTSFSATISPGTHTVQVRAVDADSLSGRTSSHGFVILPPAPTNVVAPVINKEFPSVGVEIMVSNGAWNNSPASFAYQWYLNGDAISGEISQNYIVNASLSDIITATVVAINAGGASAPFESSNSALVSENFITGTPVDMLLLPTSGTGDLLDPTNLLAASRGSAPGSWDYTFSGPATHAKIAATNFTRRTPLACNGTDYSGSGSALGVKFDMDQAIADGHGYDSFKWSPPGTFTKLSITALVKFNADGSVSSDTAIDHLVIYSGGTAFAVLQQKLTAAVVFGDGSAAGFLDPHGQIAGPTSTNGPQIDIRKDTLYSVTLRSDAAAQLVQIIVLDGATGTFVGTSQAASAMGDVTSVLFQDYLVFFGGNTQFQLLAFDWTNAAFPLEPYTLPGPASVTAVEDSGAIVVSWSQICFLFDIERKVDGGSYASLATNLTAATYTDSAVSDGSDYTYRVTNKLEGTSSVAVESNTVMMGAGGGGGSYADAIDALSPVLYLRLGDAALATTAADSSGNGLDGTYSGGAAAGTTGLLPGDADTAATLDGVDDQIFVLDDALLNITGDLTFGCIVKPSSTPSAFNSVIAKASGGGASTRQYELRTTNANKWSAVFSVGASFFVITGSTTMSTSRADHIVVTRNGSTAKLYVNGNEEASDTVSGSLNTTTGNLAIGQLGDVTSGYFPGVVDEVFVLAAGMSGADVTALYAASGL